MTLLLPARCPLPLDTVVHADLLTLCNRLESQSVDMILCDLPYGSLEVAWDVALPFEPMWAQFKRIIKPQGAIVLTAKQPFSSFLLVSNPTMYRYSWYWEKSKGANVAQTGYRPLMVIEEVLVFSHAPAVFSSVETMNYYPQRERLNRSYKRNYKATHSKITKTDGAPMRNPEKIIGAHVYEFSTPRNLFYAATDGDIRYHPTQKPVALFEYLIRTYTQPGELVLDPVAGSGTTAIAARNTGRHFICGDLSAEYVMIARNRLAQPYTLPLLLDTAPASNVEKPVTLPMFETLPVMESVST